MCLPDIDGEHAYCVAQGVESGTCESDAICPSDYRCVRFPCFPFDFCSPPLCVATCGVYTCDISQAPTCGGTCPTGEVCGQLSGQNVCGCVSPNNTCGIAQAPTCGGTCPTGNVCIGENACTCVHFHNGCGASPPGIVVLEQGEGDVVPAALIGIDPPTGRQCYILTGGFFSSPSLPRGVTFDPYGDRLLVVDGGQGWVIAVDAATGAQSRIASGLGTPTAIAVESAGRVLITDFSGSLLRFDSIANTVSLVASGGLIGDIHPLAVQMHPTGDAIVSGVSAGPAGPSRVIRIDPVSGAQTLIAEITDGNFYDFALTATYAFIAISSRGEPAAADTVSQLDLATGKLTPVISGLQRALDVKFAPNQGLLILDQYPTPVVYSASQDGSMRLIVAQGGDMFAPARLVVLPAP